MNEVNRTLYIPLYGKAFVSRRGILLQDPKAEEIWEAEGFSLKGEAKSKWLAYYMGMRSAVFDSWLIAKMEKHPDAVVLHAGCGLDSRCLRVNFQDQLWFDVDFPDVIAERKRYYADTAHYQMLASDIREYEWMQSVPKGKTVLLVMEGISMYLSPQELCTFMNRVKSTFPGCCILMDCYTTLAAKATKYKNPINEVGVTKVFGLDDPSVLPLRFVKEHQMTPETLIKQLSRKEQTVFRTVFAGKLSRRLYRLYEFSA